MTAVKHSFSFRMPKFRYKPLIVSIAEVARWEPRIQLPQLI